MDGMMILPGELDAFLVRGEGEGRNFHCNSIQGMVQYHLMVNARGGCDEGASFHQAGSGASSNEDWCMVKLSLEIVTSSTIL